MRTAVAIAAVYVHTAVAIAAVYVHTAVAIAAVVALRSCGRRPEPPKITVTTWNLQWFPNGSPRQATPARQAENISRAAEVIRALKPDILLLQEVKDWDACLKLAEALRPIVYHVAICSKFAGGNQQVAILATEHAWAAWYEEWKSRDGVDPPRGFAFAWLKVRGVDVGVYSVHLKSNLIIRGDWETENRANIRKREIATDQLLSHASGVIPDKMPAITTLLVGGDFKTNRDQEQFAGETTLTRLREAGFSDAFGEAPLPERITHPGKGRFPDATFDYLFAKGARATGYEVRSTRVSDHFAVTARIVIDGVPSVGASHAKR